jgi:type I restriction enzyme S subunit
MDVYTRDYITDDIAFMEATAALAETQRFRVESGDVLITKDSETPDDIGISAVVLDDIPNLVCGYHLALMKPNRDLVDPVYLAKQLASAESARYFGRVANGSTRYGLSYGSISATPVRLAPLSQQRRIAEILSTVDEAIEHTEALIAKTQQIKAGLMHDLFTRGVTPDGQLRPPRDEAPGLYKESPLGWIPDQWTCQNLGAILCEHGGYLQTGPFGSQLHAHEYQAEGIPFVMPQNISNGRVSQIGVARVTENRAVDLARHRMRTGDIVIARRGELSRAAAISAREEGWLCGSGCFLLRLGGSRLRADFAAYQYRQPFVQRQIERRAVGTTMASLNNEIMGGLRFLLCDQEEQDRIVERTVAVEQQLRTLSDELTASRWLKAGLMHDLLTGRVRVPAVIEEEEDRE